MPVEMVYSTAKDSIRAQVQSLMAAKYAEHGIRIKEVTYLSSINLPDKVKAAISAKIEAKQRAEQRENEVAEKEAEARKKLPRPKVKPTVCESKQKDALRRLTSKDARLPAIRRSCGLKEIEMQNKLAASAGNWQTVVLSSEQSGQLLNINGKK